MKIDNIGYNYIHGDDFYISRPNGSTDYLFLLIKSSAVIIINDKEQIVKAGSYILYEKNIPQFYRANSESFANDWIHFSADESEINELVESGITLNKPVYIGDISELSELVRKICGEHFSDNTSRGETAPLYMKILFIKLAEKLRCNGKAKNNFRKFDELRSAIYSTPSNEWSVERLAEGMNFSKSRFQHLYKQLYGTSVIADIIRSRTELAKHLLSTTDMTVKSVAELCGYSNDVHFVRQFKAQTGLTPGQFRNENIG